MDVQVSEILCDRAEFLAPHLLPLPLFFLSPKLAFKVWNRSLVNHKEGWGRREWRWRERVRAREERTSETEREREKDRGG